MWGTCDIVDVEKKSLRNYKPEIIGCDIGELPTDNSLDPKHAKIVLSRHILFRNKNMNVNV